MPQQISRTYVPSRRDRLVGLLLSVGIFMLLLPLARPIHPQAIGWIVMIIVAGLPVVTINVLLSFSRWEQKPPIGGSLSHREGSHEEREASRWTAPR